MPALGVHPTNACNPLSDTRLHSRKLMLVRVVSLASIRNPSPDTRLHSRKLTEAGEGLEASQCPQPVVRHLLTPAQVEAGEGRETVG
jgi:hypothetical protein